MSSATTSLPVPDSPSRKTVASVVATLTAAAITACQAGEVPIALVRFVVIASLREIVARTFDHARCDEHHWTNVSGIRRYERYVRLIDPPARVWCHWCRGDRHGHRSPLRPVPVSRVGHAVRAALC